MPIRFSVLIPAYNAEAFIHEALDSVALQLHAPDQIIVIDDGSTDGTAAAVTRWSQSEGIQIDLIRQENKGLPAARNQGVKISKCDWIALLDADDIFQPTHLAEMARAIALRPEIVAAFGDGVHFGANIIESMPFAREKAIAAAGSPVSDGLYVLGDDLYRSLLPGSFIMSCCLVFNRDAALDIGVYDESIKYIEDRDFLLRLSKRGRFAFVDRVTAKARVHSSNITHPANAVRNSHYSIRVLEKALFNWSDLGLTADEIKLTQEQLRRTMAQLLYSASGGGLGSYLEAVRSLVGKRFFLTTLHPKHLVRAAYYSFSR